MASPTEDTVLIINLIPKSKINVWPYVRFVLCIYALFVIFLIVVAVLDIISCHADQTRTWAVIYGVNCVIFTIVSLYIIRNWNATYAWSQTWPCLNAIFITIFTFTWIWGALLLFPCTLNDMDCPDECPATMIQLYRYALAAICIPCALLTLTLVAKLFYYIAQR